MIRIEIAVEALTVMLTQGGCLRGRCIEGLPEGARLYSSSIRDAFGRGIILQLLFLEPGEKEPGIGKVVFKMSDDRHQPPTKE